jgi:hypothetical protein
MEILLDSSAGICHEKLVPQFREKNVNFADRIFYGKSNRFT